MKEEDLLVKAPDSDEIALFPEAVSAGGWRLDCVYRFSPGKPEDGITLKIPVQAIPSLPAASLDWTVPGLLKEKIMALLRGLPKEYRKRLQPFSHTCNVILKEMAQEGPLPTALGRFIYEKFGVDIPGRSLAAGGVGRSPEAPLCRRGRKRPGTGRGTGYRHPPAGIRRGEGISGLCQSATDLGKGRCDRLGFRRASAANHTDRQRPQHRGRLPRPGRNGNGDRHPAFSFRTEAGRAHRKGVRALLALRFRDELKHLRKGIAPTGDLKLWAAAFGGVKILENALVDKVLYDLFEADVRTESDFEAHGEKVRPQILPRGQAVLRMAGPPLKALYRGDGASSLSGGRQPGQRTGPLFSCGTSG